jgi:hypothetical protein
VHSLGTLDYLDAYSEVAPIVKRRSNEKVGEPPLKLVEERS